MISIILPVYNGEEYLAKALDSIIKQSFVHFEVICIDDGSSDTTLDILNFYSKHDKRIKVYTRENKGLIVTLNEAIKLCNFDYIARMDADDVCHPDRILLQYEYLRDNPSISVLGTSYNLIDSLDNNIGMRKLPKMNFMLKSLMLFGSPFGHPTVMVNNKNLGDDFYYDERYPSAEDYELWFRLSRKYKFHCLSNLLLDYRFLSSSISRRKAEEQLSSKVKALRLHGFNNEISFDHILKFSLRKLNIYNNIIVIFKQKEIKMLNVIFQVLYCYFNFNKNRLGDE